MALDIYIVGEGFPDREDKSTIDFGDVDAYEWESLFFKDLGLKEYSEFVEEGGVPESYGNYISEQYAT